MNSLQFPIHNTKQIIFVMLACLFIGICTQSFYEHLVVFILGKMGILANRTLHLKNATAGLKLVAHISKISGHNWKTKKTAFYQT